MSHPSESTVFEPQPPADAPQGESVDEKKRDANVMMISGLGIGAFGVVAAAIGGAVCPVCVVAAPALLGVGAFRRWRATRAKK